MGNAIMNGSQTKKNIKINKQIEKEGQMSLPEWSVLDM